MPNEPIDDGWVLNSKTKNLWHLPLIAPVFRFWRSAKSLKISVRFLGVSLSTIMERNEPYRNSASAETLAVEIAAIQPRLYGYILKRLADREQTLEVLQRTNLVICNKATQFQHGSSFTAWAFTIAKLQLMAYRKAETSGRIIFTDAICDLLDRPTSEEADSVDERIALLKQCLDRLATHDIELVQRRYRDGKPIASIAASLSKSVDAVGMRLSRIRRQLADCVRIGLNREGYHDT